MDTAFLIGRILFGGYFIISGLNHFMKAAPLSDYARSKNVSSPKVAIFITCVMMLLGGLGILLGTFIAASVILLVVFLVVVAFVIHDFWDVKDEQMRMMEKINFMKNIALAGAALTMLAIPEPWYASLVL